MGILARDDGKTVEFFDSYGNPPDADLANWLTAPERAKLDESNDNQIARLMGIARNAGWNVLYNHRHLQASGSNVQTCGRHVAARLLCSDVSLDVYIDIIRLSGQTPDNFVTLLTGAAGMTSEEAARALQGGAAAAEEQPAADGAPQPPMDAEEQQPEPEEAPRGPSVTDLENELHYQTQTRRGIHHINKTFDETDAANDRGRAERDGYFQTAGKIVGFLGSFAGDKEGVGEAVADTAVINPFLRDAHAQDLRENASNDTNRAVALAQQKDEYLKAAAARQRFDESQVAHEEKARTQHDAWMENAWARQQAREQKPRNGSGGKRTS